jgi:hypothetical protein
MGLEARPGLRDPSTLGCRIFADEDYYCKQIVDGLKPLNRAEVVHHGNTVVNVRLERHHGGPEPPQWSWFDNSFSMSSEFNRLRVMMALIKTGT